MYVKEILTLTANVRASNLEEAKSLLREEYESEEIVLDSSNFQDVEFLEDKNKHSRVQYNINC